MLLVSRLFGAPPVYASLGSVVGLVPGLTFAGLAIHPGDDRMLKRLCVALLILIIVWVCSLSVRIGTIMSGHIDEGDRTCIDFRSVDVPCWVSVMHAALLATNVLLCCIIIIRRIFVSLYTKQNVGRFALMWRIWGRHLTGRTATNTLFWAPYLLFAEGRAFLGSPDGAIFTLDMLVIAALGKFALTKKWVTGLQEWLSTFGTVTDAMAIATLMSQRGDTRPLEELMTNAKRKLRYVTLSSMDVSDFDVSGRGRSQTQFSKSVRCKPREIDAFICHSWNDPQRWEALTEYCDDFEQKYNRKARLWIDIFCLDPDAASEPHYHPVYMMSAERLLVLKGPTFKDNLWCATEVLMWVEAGGSTNNIDIVPIAPGCALPVNDDDDDDNDWVGRFRSSPASTSQNSAFQFAALEVVRACGSAENFNCRVSSIIRTASAQSGDETDIGISAGGLRGRSRRLSGTILLSENLNHLSRQFEKMKPGCWW